MHRKRGKVKVRGTVNHLTEREASFEDADQEQNLESNNVERDLRVPPIEIARGNPVTGKIGSQRPAMEQHNRMVAEVEGFRYKKDHPSNAISRSESNRIYAEIRGQLYSLDAFNLPRGELTLGEMRKSHFRKLMLLRKSLEKRCLTLRRAVNFWSVDNFIDDVLRRDRIRGLTPRSKYYALNGNSETPGFLARKTKKRSNPPMSKGTSRKAGIRKTYQTSRRECYADENEQYDESDAIDDDVREEYEDDEVCPSDLEGEAMNEQPQYSEKVGYEEESQEYDQEYEEHSAADHQTHVDRARSSLIAGPISSQEHCAQRGKPDRHRKKRLDKENGQDDRELRLLREQIFQLQRETGGHDDEEEDDAFLANRAEERAKATGKRSSRVIKKSANNQHQEEASQEYDQEYEEHSAADQQSHDDSAPDLARAGPSSSKKHCAQKRKTERLRKCRIDDDDGFLVRKVVARARATGKRSSAVVQKAARDKRQEEKSQEYDQEYEEYSAADQKCRADSAPNLARAGPSSSKKRFIQKRNPERRQKNRIDDEDAFFAKRIEERTRATRKRSSAVMKKPARDKHPGSATRSRSLKKQKKT